MSRHPLWIRALLVVSALGAGSWAGGEDDRRAGTRVKPLGVVDAGGDTQAGLLTIHGHDLLPAEGEPVVKLAGQLLEVVGATPLEIQALLPAGLPPGTYLLEVLAGPDASWAAPVDVGEVADGAPPGPVPVSLLRVREAHADLVAGTLLLRGESLGTSPDTTPTVTLSDVPLTVLSADEVSVLAQLPVPLDAGAYRVRVVRTAPGGTASIWTDAMDVTTVAGAGQGDITAVNTPAGGGLKGGVTSGDANLGLVTCGLGQVLKSEGSTWACEKDADTDTGVNAVVNGGGVTGSVVGRTLTLGSTATAANVASAIVARDVAGGFSAGTITAALSGNAATATTAASFTGSLDGEVTGTQAATVVSNAVATNTPNRIVRRDGSGGFLAGTVGLAGNLGLPSTTSASVGVLTMGGTRFLHGFGSNNTFVGESAGNTTLTGGANSALGYQALAVTTTGYQNSAFGSRALAANDAGHNNSAFGYQALNANTTGTANCAFGTRVLEANTTGASNAAFGALTLFLNTTGIFNSAFGTYALQNNTEGYHNSAVGGYALQDNTEGYRNSALGAYALGSNTTGYENAAVGDHALQANTIGRFNSAFGHQALQANVEGIYNTALGRRALVNVDGGTGNTAVGWGAGENLTSGSYNIYIGHSGVATESFTLRIGENQTSTYIGGIYGQTSASGLPVHVNSSDKLGTAPSSRRYKDEIVDMSAESDVLLKLRPVAFYYRPELDETHLRQYGLVAEEVAEVAPGLVAYDEDGAPQAVRYHFVNAMLLNEEQMQRRRIEAQETEIRELRASLARLEARLH
jgi:hypothetical protein